MQGDLGKMRLFKSLLVAMTVLLAAGSASATVSVNNSSAANGSILNLGDTFTVAVNVVWDGAGTLQGIFTSTGYDESVIEFVSATSAPGSILGYFDPDTGDIIPGLNRLLQPSIIGGALRTVQYGAGSAEASADPRAANAPAGRLITTLTFRAIGAGSTDIAAIIAGGDSIAGDAFGGGTAVSVTVIPEPGTALLMGLGLAGLGFAGRRS
jgi:hypothetical protein